MADITFVTATIGGGKSLYATRAICNELATSERMIVTNVPVFLAEAPPGYMTLQEWCHKYVAHPVDVSKRVRVLSPGETAEFWRYLPGRDKLPEILQAMDGRKPELVPDLQHRSDLVKAGEIPFGCFYLIDEVHLIFRSRDWTAIGHRVEWYMSQLRKYNDDLFLITQHADKVDANFRRNATEWLLLRNMGRTRLFGGVTLKGRFQFASYCEQPRRGDSPNMSGMVQLQDKEYQKCYDTMAGVGMSGKLLPESSRMKGRHWSVWILILLAILVGAFVVPRVIMTAVGKSVGSAIAGLQGGIQGKLKPAAGAVVPPGGSPGAAAAPVVVDVVKRLEMEVAAERERQRGRLSEDVVMTGLLQLQPGVYKVTLSDGRVLDSRSPRMERLTAEGCKYDGMVYLLSLTGGPRVSSRAGGVAPVASVPAVAPVPAAVNYAEVAQPSPVVVQRFHWSGGSAR